MGKCSIIPMLVAGSVSLLGASNVGMAHINHMTTLQCQPHWKKAFASTFSSHGNEHHPAIKDLDHTGGVTVPCTFHNATGWRSFKNSSVDVDADTVVVKVHVPQADMDHFAMEMKRCNPVQGVGNDDDEEERTILVVHDAVFKRGLVSSRTDRMDILCRTRAPLKSNVVESSAVDQTAAAAIAARSVTVARNLAQQVHTVLILRVIATDAAPTYSNSDLYRLNFEDDVSLKWQMYKCSGGHIVMQPEPTYGVLDVHVNERASGTSYSTLVNDAKTAALSYFPSNVTNVKYVADHLMIVLPPGTSGGLTASAETNGRQSIYNDQRGGWISSTMHELGHNLGLSHAWYNNVEYDDMTGYMGWGTYQESSPQQCYNGADFAMLGWFDNRRLDLDPTTMTGSTQYQLNAFVDYDKSTNGEYVLLGVGQLYLVYNRAKRHNIETRMMGDRLTIVQDNSGLTNLLGGLLPGESQQITQSGRSILYEVCNAFVQGGVDVMTVSIGPANAGSACGTIHSPTKAPTHAPMTHPTRPPTRAPVLIPTPRPTRAPVVAPPPPPPTSRHPTTAPIQSNSHENTPIPTMAPTLSDRRQSLRDYLRGIVMGGGTLTVVLLGLMGGVHRYRRRRHSHGPDHDETATNTGSPLATQDALSFGKMVELHRSPSISTEGNESSCDEFESNLDGGGGDDDEQIVNARSEWALEQRPQQQHTSIANNIDDQDVEIGSSPALSPTASASTLSVATSTTTSTITSNAAESFRQVMEQAQRLIVVAWETPAAVAKLVNNNEGASSSSSSSSSSSRNDDKSNNSRDVTDANRKTCRHSESNNKQNHMFGFTKDSLEDDMEI